MISKTTFDRDINYWIPRRILEMIRSQNPSLSGPSLLSTEDPRLRCGSHVENRTVLSYTAPSAAGEALDRAAGGTGGGGDLRLGLERYNLSRTYWTTDWTAPNSFPMQDYFVLSELPPSATEEKLLAAMPVELGVRKSNIW